MRAHRLILASYMYCLRRSPVAGRRSPVAIVAGETIGYLGLVETPGSLIGGRKSKHQVHLEVFTQDPRLDDVLSNKANTKGGATYAKVPADLVLHEKKKQDGKDLWVATDSKSLEELVESPKLEKDAAKQEWVCVSSGKYVEKSQVELLSQHDWLQIGFKKIDGSGSDGYLDPDAPPAFFTNLVKSFDTDGNGELSSEEILAALQNSGNADQLHKLIVKHPSEWYEKSSASSYLWLDKLMAKIGLPDFDQLVDHEKQRIDKLEWMQSAAKLKFEKEIWHLYPLLYLQTNLVPTLSDARVRAFMRMLRVGEGTIGDKGYETLFSGKSFIKDYSRDFSDHPRIKIKSGKLISSAAGAYQVMGYTWDDPSMVKARKEYNVNDFSPLSQDIFFLILFKKKREGTLDKIRRGEIEGALDKLSYEWASLPPGRYGQPSKTMGEALSIFDQYLKEELDGKTDLKISLGVTNEF